ncbi:MAG: ArsR/SmtB family transcription factor [Acidimicrobiales bacterium]
MEAFDVLADPVRRRILDLIADRAEAGGGPLSAGEIAATVRVETGLSQPAVSQHLKVLRECGFADVTAAGTRRLYGLREDGFRQVAHWLGRYRAFWEQRLDALDTELRRGRSTTRRRSP